MTASVYIYIYTDSEIIVLTRWGSLRLAPISYNTKVAKRIYRRRNTKTGCYKKRGVLIHCDNRFCEVPSVRSECLASQQS